MVQAVDRFGRIDSLVNNAGIFIGKPFTEYTPDDYAAITAVNLTGFFHMTQRVIRQMVRQRSGHIVNISASLVEHADSESPSALAALTKGGLDAVTRSLATEYASRGVRVNAVAPGVIKTPVHDSSSYEGCPPAPWPIGEIGDIVDGILYLERATFVTGETLHIDGGQAAGTLEGRAAPPSRRVRGEECGVPAPPRPNQPRSGGRSPRGGSDGRHACPCHRGRPRGRCFNRRAGKGCQEDAGHRDRPASCAPHQGRLSPGPPPRSSSSRSRRCATPTRVTPAPRTPLRPPQAFVEALAHSGFSSGQLAPSQDAPVAQSGGS